MTPKALSRDEIVEILQPFEVNSTTVGKGSNVEIIIIGLLLDIRDLLTKENK